MDDFERQYFVQTRGEIQSIREQMNTLLWFAFFVLGGVGVAVSGSERPGYLLAGPQFVLLGPGALAVITTLFWVRRLWIQQLADRWFSLLRVLERHEPANVRTTRLETLVCERLRERRGQTYFKQEVILNFFLCLPVYAVMCASAAYRGGRGEIAVTAVIVGTHLVVSYLVLYRYASIHEKIPPVS